MPGFAPGYRGFAGLPITVVQVYQVMAELGAGPLPKDRSVAKLVGQLPGQVAREMAEVERQTGQEELGGYVVDGAH